MKESLGNKYVTFMGSWMAGSIVGNILGRIAVYGFVLWLLYKAFFS